MTTSPSTRPRIAASTSSISPASLCEPETRMWYPARRAATSTPRITSEKNSPWTSGRTMPIVWLRRMESERAATFGT